MATTRLVVAVVDDDESVRESLPDLVVALGFTARAFASAGTFLASGGIGETACLIVDVAMPDMSGPELRRELERREHQIPTIFIIASKDESLRHRLLAQGAVACLFKPFNDAELLQALTAATSLPD